MKKAVSLTLSFICIASAIFMSSCTETNSTSKLKDNNNSSSSSKSAKKHLDEEYPLIDDIEYSFDVEVINGKRKVVMNVTNNSSFTLYDFDLDLKEKEDFTLEQRKNIYDYIWKLNDVSEDKKSKYNPESDELKLEAGGAQQGVFPGCSSTFDYVRIASNTFDDLDYTELFTPDIATIYYVDNDFVRVVYYDFKLDKYTNKGQGFRINDWNDSKLAELIPVLDLADHGFEKTNINSDDELSLRCFLSDSALDFYVEYLKKCKEKGFSVDEEEYKDYWYTACNPEGYQLAIKYIQGVNAVDVNIKTPED